MYDLFDDTPITKFSEDMFDRKKIVSAVVQTINNKAKSKHSCFTIGIYAKWGEGKTSVLNMLYEQLRGNEVIVITRFNPWQFNDQSSLLFNFFDSINGKDISDEFVEILKKYAPVVSMGISGIINIFKPGLGTIINKSVSKFVKNLPDLKENVEKRKQKLSNCIVESGKHLIILIDDIDRLDKEEVHALFKLIKQTADFDNTIFIVSMDKDMVANSLCSKFENGNFYSGYNYIEKIIQFQLYLPKIQQGQLLKFLEKKIDSILSTLPPSDIINEREFMEAKQNIYAYVLPLLSTAREIIQYANVLSYSLPMIYKEINISDLCLLEALKIVYPYGYNVIRDNKHIILGENHNIFDMIVGTEEERKRKIEIEKSDFLKLIICNSLSHQKYYLHNLIEEILYSYFNSYNKIDLNNSKRLCSKQYYDKYFMYDIPDHIVSEESISKLVDLIKNETNEELSKNLEDYISKYRKDEVNRVLYKIASKHRYNGLDNNDISKICIALSLLKSNNMRANYTEFEGFDQWEFTIIDILNSYVNNIEDLKLIRDFDTIIQTIKVIAEVSPILFSIFVVVEFKRRGSISMRNIDDQNLIIYSTIKRFIKEKSAEALFGLGQLCMETLFNVWKGVDVKEYYAFMLKQISKDGFDAVDLVKTMIYNRNPKYYAPFISLFDKDIVYGKLKEEVARKPNLRENEKDINLFMTMYEGEIRI